MEDKDIQYTLGSIQAKLETMEKQQAENHKQIQNVNKFQTELKAGKKVLLYIVAASGALGSAISWIITHVTFKAG